MLSQEELKALVSYDPETGFFTRLVACSPTARPGPLKPPPRPDRYLRATVAGHRFMLHRMAFLYMTGAIPTEVDHINGVRDDNRWCNLRPADRLLNMQNIRQSPRSSKSGILGASPRNGRFRAMLNVRGTVHHLGTFDTAEEANAAYLKAKRLLHPGCTI